MRFIVLILSALPVIPNNFLYSSKNSLDKKNSCSEAPEGYIWALLNWMIYKNKAGLISYDECLPLDCLSSDDALLDRWNLYVDEFIQLFYLLQMYDLL